MKRTLISIMCIFLSLALIVALGAEVYDLNIVPISFFTALELVSNIDLGFDQLRSMSDICLKSLAIFDLYQRTNNNSDNSSNKGGYSSGVVVVEKKATWEVILSYIFSPIILACDVVLLACGVLVDVIEVCITLVDTVDKLISGVAAPDDYKSAFEKYPDPHKYVTN